LYDKKQYEKAAAHWEASVAKNPSFPIPFRNLSIAYFNKLGRKNEALEMICRAYEINPQDARLLLEKDQLDAKMGAAIQTRLAYLENHIEVVRQRDDLYTEYITLLNNSGQFKRAYECICGRKFHPWEGGEGKVSRQYVYSLVEMAKQELRRMQPEKAAELLKKALEYPENLGEGKLPNTPDNIIHYYLGRAYELQGNGRLAAEYWEKAAVGMKEPAGMLYYNDQPADNILYQGLACNKLGRSDQAGSEFHKLVSYGEKHLFDEVVYDYFAVSVPDTMVYESDITFNNKIYCIYLLALGKFGLGNVDAAQEKLKDILAQVPDHQGAIRHLALMNAENCRA
jgi:tetratricopeptide (TPR) repeat protein